MNRLDDFTYLKINTLITFCSNMNSDDDEWITLVILEDDLNPGAIKFLSF